MRKQRYIIRDVSYDVADNAAKAVTPFEWANLGQKLRAAEPGDEVEYDGTPIYVMKEK